MSESNSSPQSSQTETRPSKLQKREHKPLVYPVTKLWGSLPKIHLTKYAVNELNYQNRQQKTFRVQYDFNQDICIEQLESIRQLAREGGPDLTDLRGYPEPGEYAMESGEPSQSSRRTKQSGTGKKTKTSGPYDKNFEAMLESRGIYFDSYNGPKIYSSIVPLNLEELIERANQPRASVTPVTYPNSFFETCKTTIREAEKESEVVKHLVPILEGGIRVENQGYKDTTFSNLEPFTDGTIEQRALVKGTPDRCYGSPCERLCEKVREDLNGKVVPTPEKTNPIAPNFFLELKGPEGHQKIADLQARYYGALGERGQIALRSWGHDEPVLDGMAHTISCTFVAGLLKFYSIHAARSSDLDSCIEYFMHPIDIFGMDLSASKFRNAIAAYQNLQDYAEEKRNEAIGLANARARVLREASS